VAAALSRIFALAAVMPEEQEEFKRMEIAV
jgi:hypothetical protein